MSGTDAQRFRRCAERWSLRLLIVVVVAVLLGGLYMAIRLMTDRAQVFDDPDMHFKYGSTGGDRNFGIPFVVWQALPVLFAKYLPEGKQDLGWAAFGFIYEYEGEGAKRHLRNRPVGTSLRNYQGIERIFLNCAVCHTGTVRRAANAEPQVYVGMPANRIDLQGFQDFLIAAAQDERFTPQSILAQIDAMGLELDWINRAALHFYGIYAFRERILTIAQRFRFAEYEPAFGPGRFDTFSPAKALLNWPLEDLPPAERIGVVDFPSVWQQGKREGMQLHWDGNNTKVQERNRSAAFGTGAMPTILDRPSIRRVEDDLLVREPPSFAALFPEHFDPALADKGKPLYDKHCARCHGRDGRDFTGEWVGRVTVIDKIGTDRHRLDNYSLDLSMNQNVLYAEFGDERFQNFRKTNGYANAPLDGLWLRAPYLHNGSVPTLWDLLRPPAERPNVFYRGYDVYDPRNVGFESRPAKIPEAMRKQLFCYATDAAGEVECAARPRNNGLCNAETCPGNGNGGHLYGVWLSAPEKWALIEYLKTF